MNLFHLAIALLLSAASVTAAPIYRCGPDGRTYSQTPCPVGSVVESTDPRTAAQRAEARRVQAAVQVQHLATAGALVQVVDVLRDQGEAGHALRQRRDGEVRRVRLCAQHPHATPLVPILNEKKNLRLPELKGLEKEPKRKGLDVRSVVGGFLVQERDVWFADQKTWKIVTKTKPTKEDLIAMDFAVKCVKHVKSNSVVFVKGTRTVGIGGRQTSRVDATWIATHKGKDQIKGSIMASDAFFPFRDAVDVAVNAGVKAIIQPGGSIHDEEVIEAANEQGISMVFSGQRYFRH